MKGLTITQNDDGTMSIVPHGGILSFEVMGLLEYAKLQVRCTQIQLWREDDERQKKKKKKQDNQPRTTTKRSKTS